MMHYEVSTATFDFKRVNTHIVETHHLCCFFFSFMLLPLNIHVVLLNFTLSFSHSLICCVVFTYAVSQRQDYVSSHISRFCQVIVHCLCFGKITLDFEMIRLSIEKDTNIYFPSS